MVWMDDDGSINALPWDMGSWSVGSGEPSPSGSGVTGAPEALGEPVGQDVLITALNRRVSRGGVVVGESTELMSGLRCAGSVAQAGCKAGARWGAGCER